MKQKLFLRPTLAIVFAFIGVLVAQLGIPSQFFGFSRILFLAVAAVAFGTLGFILPQILEFAGRAGITALANQLTSIFPIGADLYRIGAKSTKAFTTSALSFGSNRRKKTGYTNPLVVDTSVLVDGRLTDVAKTGFLFGTLLVIPAVVSELHRLADSADELKRIRGRRGLDSLSLLQQTRVKVEMINKDPKGLSVDEMLVKLAKELKGKIVTVDYNLNKVAKVQGVAALNLNELASAVRTVVLPGERLSITISAKGRTALQGVGYLDDGTMVVIENGADMIGRKVEVSVNKVLQSAAGKMVFARLQAPER